jgi:hypothetical protein
MPEPLALYQAGHACVATKTAAAEFVASQSGVAEYGYDIEGRGWTPVWCVWRGEEGQLVRSCFSDAGPELVGRFVVPFEPVPCGEPTQVMAFQALNVSPDGIALAFAWGFGAVLLMWSLGYAVDVCKRLIAKI